MIKPLRGYVLIEPIDEEAKTASGLLLPESAKDKPMKGKVLAIGNIIFERLNDGCAHTIAPECKIDDIVIYKQWGGQDIKSEGKELKLVKFDELMAIDE